TLPTTETGPYSLMLYTDNPVITLKATQNGTETRFVYNWLANCQSPSRIGTSESPATLQVQLLGNPARNGRLSVQVSGATGQALNLSLIDAQGKQIDAHQVEQADSQEQHTFDLSRQSTGTLLLRAATATQSQTVRVIKAD
ncbi:T9SS type A sorting domain-containing protein, partial [uncultured Spirosoma sp.]|uniref:T9SS type A sorting domain-containing protein n=1 Tax=uncultured Spirosoma sp. TaxID=278208 RepID=UPI00258F079C